MPEAPALRRTLTLPLLALYGLGTTVGAGIYVLVGEVAATAGSLAPLSFLVAALLAAATAFSFGELCARYPKSAGEAVYVNAAFKRAWLAALVGLMVVSVGTISSAAIANGFAGYARQFVDLPPWALIVGVLILLTAIAIWGITESVTLAAVVTVLEIGGLLIIVAVGANAAAKAPLPAFSLCESGLGVGVLAGAVLAFYAFLGFEDMINVAEETRDPARTMPRAIVLTLVITTVLYIVVAGIAVLVVPIAELAVAEAPLAAVYEHATGRFPAAIGVIGTVAVINGALVQIIMASRVLYGLAQAGWLPQWLATLHPRTRTPLFATLLVGSAVTILAVTLPLVRLAEATSVITLCIFALVNAALWRIKARGPAPEGLWTVPLWVPVVGFFSSLAFVLFNIWRHAI